MTDSIEEKIMNWCHVHGTKLNASNVTTKQFNQSLTYIETKIDETVILALKSKAVGKRPHSLLLRLLTVYATFNEKQLTVHFDNTIYQHFKKRIYWIKKALFLDISLFTPSFLNYCETCILQCVFPTDIPIEAPIISQIQSFIECKQIRFDSYHKFNTIKNGNIFYVTGFTHRNVGDIETIFKRFGSNIEEIIRIPYEYISKKEQLYIKFRDPSKVKSILYGGVLCSNRTSSNKFQWVSLQLFNRIKSQQSKQQPFDRIIISLRAQQTDLQVMRDLNKYKRSVDVRSRELYFKAIKSMIKSTQSNDVHIALVQLRKDLEEFQTEGKFYLIPKEEINEISQYILSYIDVRNRIQLEYDENKWQSNANESIQSAMKNMIKVTNKQIQAAMVEVLVEINRCIVTNKQQFNYFEISFRVSIVLEHLYKSFCIEDKLFFLNILNKINDKTIINKYFHSVMDFLSETNFELYFHTLKTIKYLCCNGGYNIDKDLVAAILTSLQNRDLSGSEWELCGLQLYELINGNSLMVTQSLVTQSLNIFSNICKHIFSNDDFKIAYCIWIEMGIKYGTFKYNNNINMNIIANTIIKVFIPIESLSEDQNKRMYEFGISILRKLFSDCRVDIKQFITQIKLKSEQDSILIASVLLDCNLKDTILFAVQNMITGNRTFQKIINFFDSKLSTLEAYRLLTFVYRLCMKMEQVAYETKVYSTYVTPICKDIIELMYKLLLKSSQNEDIILAGLQVLSQCSFLDLHNEILCNYKYYPHLIQFLHELLSNYATTNSNIIDAAIKCVSTVLYICKDKYIEFNRLWIILENIYKVKKTKGIIECISYLISAHKSLDTKKAMEIAIQILKDNKNNTSEIILSLAHNLSLRIEYKTFKPLMDTVMNELLMPLERLYNPKYSRQTDTILASELEKTHQLLTYLKEFLSIYGANMKMPRIHRIIQSLRNILHESYNNAITSNIKFVCYENIDHVIEITKNKKKVTKNIYSFIYSKMSALEKKKKTTENDYEEFVVLSKILQFISINLKEKQNEIEDIVSKVETKLNESDEIDEIQFNKVKLHPIGEEDEDELFDNIDCIEHSQYKNKYGPILTIYKKIQNAKRRKCLSPLNEPN